MMKSTKMTTKLKKVLLGQPQFCQRFPVIFCKRKLEIRLMKMIFYSLLSRPTNTQLFFFHSRTLAERARSRKMKENFQTALLHLIFFHTANSFFVDVTFLSALLKFNYPLSWSNNWSWVTQSIKQCKAWLLSYRYLGSDAAVLCFSSQWLSPPLLKFLYKWKPDIEIYLFSNYMVKSDFNAMLIFNGMPQVRSFEFCSNYPTILTRG